MKAKPIVINLGKIIAGINRMLGYKVFYEHYPILKSKPGIKSQIISTAVVPTWGPIDYYDIVNEGYNYNSLVHRCVSYKATTASQAPIRAYTTVDGKAVDLGVKHPLAKLLSQPNSYMSGFEWMELNHTYLELAGNSFVIIDPGDPGSSVPNALIPIRPDRMRPVPDYHGNLLGYVYESNVGVRQPFLPEAVMHIKYPNPLDDFEGLGLGVPPMLAASRVTVTDNSMTNFIKAFFDNSGVLSGIIKTKQKLLDDEVDDIQRRWREKHGGDRQWEVAVLDMDTDYVQMGSSFQDMTMPTLDSRNEARICQAFGVPPILVGAVIGLMRSTYSNYEAARTAFWEDTMMPQYKRFEMEFRRMLAYEDVYVAFDFSGVPALKEDFNIKVKNFVALTTKGIPIQTAAQLSGIVLDEGMPGTQFGYLPAGLVATTAIAGVELPTVIDKSKTK